MYYSWELSSVPSFVVNCDIVYIFIYSCSLGNVLKKNPLSSKLKTGMIYTNAKKKNSLNGNKTPQNGGAVLFMLHNGTNRDKTMS